MQMPTAPMPTSDQAVVVPVAAGVIGRAARAEVVSSATAAEEGSVCAAVEGTLVPRAGARRRRLK